MKAIIRVKEVMKPEFVLVDGLSTVQEGIQMLLKENAHTLFIKPRSEDDEYGIVVLADIAQKVLAQHKAPERVNLYEIMTKPIIGVDPEMDTRYCARLFSRFGLSVAPVIENRKIIGVVTYNNIVLHNLEVQR